MVSCLNYRRSLLGLTSDLNSLLKSTSGFGRLLLCSTLASVPIFHQLSVFYTCFQYVYLCSAVTVSYLRHFFSLLQIWCQNINHWVNYQNNCSAGRSKDGQLQTLVPQMNHACCIWPLYSSFLFFFWKYWHMSLLFQILQKLLQFVSPI